MNYVERIIEFLEEEYKVFERVLNFSNEKIKYIVENNFLGIIEILNQEKKEIEIISKFEEERQKILDVLVKEKNKVILNFNDFVFIVILDEWQKINDLKEKFGEIIFKLKKVNDLNVFLVLSVFEYIDFMINVILLYFLDIIIY